MRPVPLALMLLIFATVAGCGRDEIAEAFARMTKINIQKATMMYTVYVATHDYRGPDNLEEMIEFLTTDPDGLKRMNRVQIDVDRLEEFLIGRDGEVFEFRWSIQSNPMAAPYPVCWEREGFEGTVRVGVSGGRVVETGDEGELADLKAGKYNDGGSYGSAQEQR